jgi:hypothetical protein
MIPVLDDTGFLAGVGLALVIAFWWFLRNPLELSQEEAFIIVSLLVAVGGVIIMYSMGAFR